MAETSCAGTGPTVATADSRALVLCVDDEPQILAGLAMHLRRRYEVATANSGAAGLELIRQGPAPAVVVSDMRMPGMSGAEFLGQVRRTAPDTVRLLLTGQSDLASAIAAVNDGQLFRFLTKPCPPQQFLAAIDAAAEQHRLITSERELLEKTLHGCIQALTGILALTNPVSFGRTTRIRKHVTCLADRLGVEERWQIDVAAMVSQIGCIVLRPHIAEKLYFGAPMTAEEQAETARLPEVMEQLLGSIPRLENVRAILRRQGEPADRGPSAAGAREPAFVARGAQILSVASDFDTLEAQGLPWKAALDVLRSRDGRYDPAVVDALHRHFEEEVRHRQVREVPVGLLKAGMVLAEDVANANGALVIARGIEVSAGFIERLRNFEIRSVRVFG